MKQIQWVKTGALVLLLACTGIIAASCGGAASTGSAAQAERADADGGRPGGADFIYRLNEARDGVVITGIQKDAGFGANLVVPAEIEGFPVVAYMVRYSDQDAKQRNVPPLVSVVFPDSIRYMGDGGTGEDEYGYREFEKFRRANLEAEFSRCASLRRIVFPKNLVIIPERFAANCPGLTPGGITWPEALEIIGKEAFYKNTFTELVIPAGAKIIGREAFSGGLEGNTTLQSLAVPDSVEVIHGKAFANSSVLSAVAMPAHPVRYPGSVMVAENGAFEKCPRLSLAAQAAILDSGYPDQEL